MKKQLCPIYSASVRIWVRMGGNGEGNEVGGAYTCILFPLIDLDMPACIHSTDIFARCQETEVIQTLSLP